MIWTRPITSRDEWLSWRKEALTASDIGAVAGVDQYRTPLQVYADKTGFSTPDESPIMRRGRMFEAAAVEYLREDHPDWQIEKPHKFYMDVDLRLGCTPDALAFHDGRTKNIQIKTVTAPAFEKWDGEPPKSYLLQTVCENMLTDANAGMLAVLVVSTFDAELVEFEVPRHAAAESRIADIAREFWHNVKAGLVPVANYEQDAELVSLLYPPDPAKPSPLDLTGDNRIMEILAQRETLKADVKEAETALRAIDAEIIDKLQGSERAELQGWKIAHTMTNRGAFTVEAKSFPVLRVKRVEVAA